MYARSTACANGARDPYQGTRKDRLGEPFFDPPPWPLRLSNGATKGKVFANVASFIGTSA